MRRSGAGAGRSNTSSTGLLHPSHGLKSDAVGKKAPMSSRHAGTLPSTHTVREIPRLTCWTWSSEVTPHEAVPGGSNTAASNPNKVTPLPSGQHKTKNQNQKSLRALFPQKHRALLPPHNFRRLLVLAGDLGTRVFWSLQEEVLRKKRRAVTDSYRRARVLYVRATGAGSPAAWFIMMSLRGRAIWN